MAIDKTRAHLTKQARDLSEAIADWANAQVDENEAWEQIKKDFDTLAEALLEARDPRPNEPVTDDQVNAAFKLMFGHDAREADKRIVQLSGGTREALADYIWDHWLGEPTVPSADTILKMIP